MKGPVLLGILKAPLRGRVKTRLAATLGDERASRIYEWMVARQIEHLPGDWPLQIHFDPPEALDQVKQWIPSASAYLIQSGSDLGERMENAVRQAFCLGVSSVHLFGGDCPFLTEKHFLEAERLLQEGADCVYGPSEDGGFYLLSMRSPVCECFRGIEWSSPHTLADSLRNLAAAQRRTHLLETLFDIDTAGDLVRLSFQPGMPFPPCDE